jgi:hypothetical protein
MKLLAAVKVIADPEADTAVIVATSAPIETGDSSALARPAIRAS